MIYIDDHVSRALAIITAKRRTPRVMAIVRALAQQVQAAEDATYDLSLSLDDATGGWLDRLGRVVGEARDGLADVDYRRFLRVRLLVTRSEGGQDTILAIADAITGGVTPIYPAYPAGYTLLLRGPLPLSSEVLARTKRRLVEATSAAVGVELYDATGLDPETEIFLHDESEHDSSALQVRAL